MPRGLNLDPIKLRLTLGLLSLLLTGCASLAASPTRVMGVAPSMELVNHYSMPVALRAFADETDSAKLREGLSQEQYRNMVISVYLNAMDAQYYQWRSQVSDERRELGTGFDSMVIALTGAASVARQSLVRSLSATASIMAGTHGAIDRNVYFDRALPGLLAAMDTQRLRVLTRITQNLEKTAREYPMATAFADLSAYELAASLDRAIEEITAQASEQRQEAQTSLNDVVQACAAGPGATVAAGRLTRYVDQFYPGNPGFTPAMEVKLLRIAGAMNVTATGSAENYYVAIMDRISAGQDGHCSVTDLENLIARVSQATGDQF